MRKTLLLLVFTSLSGLIFLFCREIFVPQVFAEKERLYVGSKACSSCHEEEYESFIKNSKKAHSFASVKKMQKGLTPTELRECFRCHTTGYGKPGGFVSEKATPDLKNLGCEACHGPGSVHVESEDASDIIGQVDKESCGSCHNSERVNAFRYKPILYSGAH